MTNVIEQAVLVDPDGTVEVRSQSADVEPWRFIHDSLGGYFEVVPLAPGLDMWVLDDGEGQVLNLPAMAIAYRVRGWQHPLRGPALFTGVDASGNSQALNPKRVEWLQRFCEEPDSAGPVMDGGAASC